MYIEPTQEAGAAFFGNPPKGPVDMLNMLRFREVADYSKTPKLAPAAPISGAEAYKLYAAHTMPFLLEAGGEVLFRGTGGLYLIGPADDCWDVVMIIRHQSAEHFVSFARNKKYLAGVGHRTAALEDSRLLPITQHRGVL